MLGNVNSLSIRICNAKLSQKLFFDHFLDYVCLDRCDIAYWLVKMFITSQFIHNTAIRAHTRPSQNSRVILCLSLWYDFFRWQKQVAKITFVDRWMRSWYSVRSIASLFIRSIQIKITVQFQRYLVKCGTQLVQKNSRSTGNLLMR